MGPTFSTILNEFWTDFLQFSAKDGGVSHPPTPPLMCAPVHYFKIGPYLLHIAGLTLATIMSYLNDSADFNSNFQTLRRFAMIIVALVKRMSEPYIRASSAMIYGGRWLGIV